MLTYCLKGRKIENIKSLGLKKTIKGKLMLLSDCTLCNNKIQDLLNSTKLVDY